MVATQQVRENNDMGGLNKEWLIVVYSCRRQWLHTIPKAGMTHAK
jgi:hypothetical protein